MLRALSLALLPLFFGVNAFASGFSCHPDPHTSQMAVSWDPGKTISLYIENPRGYASMPQFDSGLSEEMIPFVKMQTEDLRGLAEGFQIEWKASQCKITRLDEALFQCGGGGTLKNFRGEAIAGIQALGVTAAWLSEVSLDAPQRNYRLRLTFEKDGNTYFVSLPFPAQFCHGF